MTKLSNYCALVIVCTVLSVPSLLGNAFFIVGRSGRQIITVRNNEVTPVVPEVVLHESSSNESSDEPVTTSETTTIEEEEPASPSSSSSSWFDNNDSMSDSIFDKIDTDQDGSITNDELQTHLEGIGYSNMSIQTLFGALDKNEDGLISREEMRFAFTNYDIQALYQAFGIGTPVGGQTDTNKEEEVYTKAINSIRSNANIDSGVTSSAILNILADLIFDRIDTDQSGEIDSTELKEHFLNANIERGDIHFDDLSAESILEALDLNADGGISRDEMRTGFNQFNPKSLSKALGYSSDSPLWNVLNRY
eukprot:CAMPEP_0170858366 /NCGR_PEP_ID=MMETSP0734-20130129/15948_1 /TAXON_ID=186038 /ORGANISM="Fragilariopsis kerguelensis, Strain L26-C5" /LENGTH=306 /DNA_ID=CAMNT_0011230987 /DNA_START=22 /DNA_END=942 /DNA_ORIENTATION=-